MNSSTSVSDPDPPGPWRRWLLCFVGTFFGLGGVLFALLLAIDPHDTGRFPGFGIVGVDDHNPRTAHVSRARDPRFDSAVIGNSTGQLIDPRRLSADTGLRFTQLTIPGTGPLEQIAVLEWFLSRHARVGAIVLTTDPSWCARTTDLTPSYPFPFWLYGSDLDYLRHIVNGKSIDRAVWRIQVAAGLRPRNDPIGYEDYVGGRTTTFIPPAAPPVVDLSTDGAPLRFPWVDRLSRIVAELPAETRVVAFMPAVHASSLGDGPVIAACKTALAAATASRPNTAFVDARVDDIATRDPANFMDGLHYGHTIARVIEDRIIAALRSDGHPSARGAAKTGS